MTGSVLVQAAVWLRTLFGGGFAITRTLAADTRLSIAGQPLQLSLVEGGLRGDHFWIGWTVRAGRQPPSPPSVEGQRVGRPKSRAAFSR